MVDELEDAAPAHTALAQDTAFDWLVSIDTLVSDHQENTKMSPAEQWPWNRCW